MARLRLRHLPPAPLPRTAPVRRVSAWPVVVMMAALLLTTTWRHASAAWPELGRAITTAPNEQDHSRITSDGAGGAIITWQDERGGEVHIFAQHVMASGELDAAWPVNGRALLTDPLALATALGGQKLPVIASDGAGGAIVAWQDERTDLHGPDVFAQHVLASGVVDPAWPANGRALSTAQGVQDNATIVADGAGGAIVAWMDGRAGGSASGSGVDIFAQHVLSSGLVDPNWPVDGAALCTAPATQAFPRIATDRAGGAIVTWYDFRPSSSQIDVYAQHVLGSGVVDPAWPVDGRALTTAASSQLDPSIVSDGLHGAIVAWTDARDGLNHIYAQRVLGSGAIAPGWPANGLAVCTAPVDQITPVVTSDGAGGAIATWQDARNGTNHQPFAQHVLASGAVDAGWPVDGRALSLASGEASNGSIVIDGSGGAIIAWEEDSFVKANHVLASGLLDPAFPVNGVFVRLDLSFQSRPDLVAGGAGNAIVAWTNRETDSDIYALLVGPAGTVSAPPVAPGGITFAAPSPNPARGPFTLRFTLPREANVRLAIFDASGRRVRVLASGTQPPGDHAMAWDLRDETGRSIDAGLYFARFEAEGQTFTHKLVAVR